jgi:hypothetical protein
MIKAIAIFVFSLGFGASYAQEAVDSIYVSKTFWGYKYYQGNFRINFNQLPEVMEYHADATMFIDKARNRHTLSAILSGAGGFLIGLQLANEIIGGEANWAMVAVGGGLIAISIPISASSNKLTIKAVDAYNRQLMSRTEWKSQLSFGVSNNGIGLNFLF